METDQSDPVRRSRLGQAQTEAEAEDRKLIKFSNYSLCVTLPKWVVKELRWQKGEVVKMFVDEKRGEILIKKAARSATSKIGNKTVDQTIKKPQLSKKSRW